MTKENKEIVFVISDMGGGGAQQVASQIMNAWACKGYKIALITLSSPEEDFFPANEKIKRISIGLQVNSLNIFQKIKNNITRIWRIRKAIQQLNYKTAMSFIGPTNILLIIAAIGLDYKVIISERNDPSVQSFGKIWDFLRKKLYGRANLVTANSLGAISSLKNFIPAEKIVYLPNPLRQHITTPNTQIEREPIFLNVGRLHKQKGQDLLLEAFAKITNQLPNWQLHIAGNGTELNYLKSLSKKLKIENKVNFLGYVSNPSEQYQKASIFVFPSRYEGMPNALLEAMASGLPVISSNRIPDHKRIFDEHPPGISIDPESTKAMAEAMLQLAKSEEARKQFSISAKNKIKPFQISQVLPEWEKQIWKNTYK